MSLTDVLPNDNQFWEQEGPNWSHAIVCSMRLGLSAAGASASKFLAISGSSGFFISLPSSRGSEVPALLGVGAGGNYLLPGQCGKVEEWGCEQLHVREERWEGGERGLSVQLDSRPVVRWETDV